MIDVYTNGDVLKVGGSATAYGQPKARLITEVARSVFWAFHFLGDSYVPKETL